MFIVSQVFCAEVIVKLSFILAYGTRERHSLKKTFIYAATRNHPKLAVRAQPQQTPGGESWRTRTSSLNLTILKVRVVNFFLCQISETHTTLPDDELL